MDLALNNLQRLIYHKNQASKQTKKLLWGKIIATGLVLLLVFTKLYILQSHKYKALIDDQTHYNDNSKSGLAYHCFFAECPTYITFE